MKRCVLILSDHPSVAAPLADALRDSGCRINLARNAGEAFRKTAGALPDLIILYHPGPREDLDSLLPALQRIRKLRYVPKLVLNGSLGDAFLRSQAAGEPATINNNYWIPNPVRERQRKSDTPVPVSVRN